MKTTHTLQSIMNFISSVLPTLLIIVLVGIMVFLSLPRVDSYLNLKTQELRQSAIADCAENGKYTYTEVTGNITEITEEPSQVFFQKCLELNRVK